MHPFSHYSASPLLPLLILLPHLEEQLPLLLQLEDLLEDSLNVVVILGRCLNICTLPHVLKKQS